MIKTEHAHAKLSASGSEIWLNCPGSVALSEKAPPQKESPYAVEGTGAHSLLEAWLTHTRDKTGAFVFPKKVVCDDKGKKIDVTPGMIQAVRVCIDDVKKSRKLHHDLVIEKKVYLTCVDPSGNMHGTLDLGIVEDFGTLEITDYKHGSGVKVELFKESASGHRSLNTQLVYYALAFAEEYGFNFKDVILKIVQPRCAQGTPISQVKVPMKELLSYIDLFKKGVERTKRKDAKRFAGPWCRFCKAKPICKESQGGYRTDARGDF
jgi:hypothetical protein